jgi:hypothetical protein
VRDDRRSRPGGPWRLYAQTVYGFESNLNDFSSRKATISYIYAVIMASLCGQRGLVLSVMGCLAHLASIASEPKIDPLWEYYDLIHSQKANVCTVPINRGQSVAEYIFEMYPFPTSAVRSGQWRFHDDLIVTFEQEVDPNNRGILDPK